jgi:AcrR family transcriptional regulator
VTPDLTHKRERRKDARPGELLEAALQLFVQKGYAATKVEDVAALAGVSKGTLFLYFPTKEDLLKAVVSENLAEHFPAWNQAFESFEGSSAEMLRFALHSWWEKIGSTPASGICKLMISESRNFPDLLAFYVESVMRPGNILLRRILERGMANGEFRPMDADIAVHTIVAPMRIGMMLMGRNGMPKRWPTVSAAARSLAQRKGWSRSSAVHCSMAKPSLFRVFLILMRSLHQRSAK